jgi:hypothetical protein
MIVQRRGNQPERQRAVYLERDETGHFDFGTIELRSREWGHFTGISMVDGNRCEVFEKDADGPLFRPMSLRRR